MPEKVRMIAAYHLIWTAYGWWLPNDPRGSGSRIVHRSFIADLGELHYGRKRLQPADWVIRDFYREANAVLKHDLLTFADPEIEVVANAFGEVIASKPYTCYACAVMPDHVHLLIRKHRDTAETMIAELQEASRTAIVAHGRRAKSHPVWGGPGWKVYLETADDIRRVIAYIEANPRKAKRPNQAWGWVRPYDGWLPGLSPVRRAKPQARGKPAS
jgi:REP element-mobilizing transposase RayT